MRWLVLVLFLCAFTPIYVTHDTQDKVDDEFVAVYGQAQPNQMKVFVSTPNLNDLKDGELVIVSSSTVRAMFRTGQDIFAINVSCVTVRR